MTPVEQNFFISTYLEQISSTLHNQKPWLQGGENCIIVCYTLNEHWMQNKLCSLIFPSLRHFFPLVLWRNITQWKATGGTRLVSWCNPKDRSSRAAKQSGRLLGPREPWQTRWICPFRVLRRTTEALYHTVCWCMFDIALSFLSGCSCGLGVRVSVILFFFSTIVFDNKLCVWHY